MRDHIDQRISDPDHIELNRRHVGAGYWSESSAVRSIP
jgi:hypothetical protein